MCTGYNEEHTCMRCGVTTIWEEPEIHPCLPVKKEGKPPCDLNQVNWIAPLEVWDFECLLCRRRALNKSKYLAEKMLDPWNDPRVRMRFDIDVVLQREAKRLKWRDEETALRRLKEKEDRLVAVARQVEVDPMDVDREEGNVQSQIAPLVFPGYGGPWHSGQW
jgi:hypothetical protein